MPRRRRRRRRAPLTVLELVAFPLLVAVVVVGVWAMVAWQTGWLGAW